MNKKIILCFLILCVATEFVCCKGSRSSGRSRSSGSHSSRGGSSSSYKPSSSWSSGSSWKPSSSSRHSYPSSSSGLSGSYKPSYPSPSSGLSGSGSIFSSIFSGSGSLKPSYPSSSSGLSGYGSSKPSYPSSTGLSGSGSKPSYPTSSSGLSGFGSNKPSSSSFDSSWRIPGYPPSLSGLSGTGSSKPSYPPASTGLSGFGSSKPSYPSSSSGLSGSGSSRPSYPNLSGFGAGTKPSYPPSMSGSGSHSYSGSNVFSGSITPKAPSYPGVHFYPTSSGNNYKRPTYDTSYHPSNTYNTHKSYGSGSYGHGYIGNTHTTYVLPPNYHTHPQYVYVNEYRNSGSRYGDILTGLALYNMGRSHSHYHDHYYYDDYYRIRHNSYSQSTNSYTHSAPPKDTAVCTLRVKESGKLEVLKVPCEIVSTFVEDGKRSNYTQTQTNTTTCITQVTTTTDNNTVLVNDVTTNSPTISTEQVSINAKNTTLPPYINETTTIQPTVIPQTFTTQVSINPVESDNITAKSTSPQNNTPVNVMTSLNSSVQHIANVTTKASLPGLVPIQNSSQQSANILQNFTTNDANDKHKSKLGMTGNVTTMNVTTCTTISNTMDPLQVKGPPVNEKNMECAVEIVTKQYLIRNEVDCNILIKYAKMPQKSQSQPIIAESPVLPSRNKLKSWLDNPPWWLSLFIAV